MKHTALTMLLATVLAGCSQDVPKTGTAHFETWCNSVEQTENTNPEKKCACGAEYLATQSLTEQQEHIFYNLLQDPDRYLERKNFPTLAEENNMETADLKSEIIVLMDHFAKMESLCSGNQ